MRMRISAFFPRGGSLEAIAVLVVSVSIRKCKEAMSEQLRLRGTLKGHGGWVTQIATTASVPDMILSASRGVFGH